MSKKQQDTERLDLRHEEMYFQHPPKKNVVSRVHGGLNCYKDLSSSVESKLGLAKRKREKWHASDW